tara:strand:+ start:644 stop:1000 length:357 start_codon:yes stop_codon:yes gene_type:complete
MSNLQKVLKSLNEIEENDKVSIGEVKDAIKNGKVYELLSQHTSSTFQDVDLSKKIEFRISDLKQIPREDKNSSKFKMKEEGHVLNSEYDITEQMVVSQKQKNHSKDNTYKNPDVTLSL